MQRCLREQTESKPTQNTDRHTPVHSSVTHSGRPVEATQVSADGRREKENEAKPYNAIIFRLKKKAILKHGTTWMDLKGITLNETSQSKAQI